MGRFLRRRFQIQDQGSGDSLDATNGPADSLTEALR